MAAMAGTVNGKMIVNGKEHTLTAVLAAKVKDGGNEILRVVLSDVPLPPKAVFEEMDLFSLGADGKFHGIQLDFSENGVTMMLRSKDMEGSFSHSQSPNPFTLKQSGDRVEGEIIDKQTGEDKHVRYDISVKFSAQLETKVVEAAPTAADAEAAKRHPAAITYVKLQEAIRKGDKAAIRAMAPPEARAQIDGPDFPEMLKMIQAMQEKDVRVLKAVTNGNESTLILQGKSAEGTVRKGEATLVLENGNWIMRNEKWKGN